MNMNKEKLKSNLLIFLFLSSVVLTFIKFNFMRCSNLDYKKSYFVALVGFCIGIIAIFLGAAANTLSIGYVGFILIIGSLVQTIIFYRCPKCDSPFNIRGKKPKHCPECCCKLE